MLSLSLSLSISLSPSHSLTRSLAHSLALSLSLSLSLSVFPLMTLMSFLSNSNMYTDVPSRSENTPQQSSERLGLYQCRTKEQLAIS